MHSHEISLCSDATSRCTSWLPFSRQDLLQPSFPISFTSDFVFERTVFYCILEERKSWSEVLQLLVWNIFCFSFNMIQKKECPRLCCEVSVKCLLAQKMFYGFQPLLQYLWSGTGTTPINTCSVHDALYFFFTWSVSFKCFPHCTLLWTLQCCH